MKKLKKYLYTISQDAHLLFHGIYGKYAVWTGID